jgi:hypothetical protein
VYFKIKYPNTIKGRAKNIAGTHIGEVKRAKIPKRITVSAIPR